MIRTTPANAEAVFTVFVSPDVQLKTSEPDRSTTSLIVEGAMTWGPTVVNLARLAFNLADLVRHHPW